MRLIDADAFCERLQQTIIDLTTNPGTALFAPIISSVIIAVNEMPTICEPPKEVT